MFDRAEGVMSEPARSVWLACRSNRGGVSVDSKLMKRFALLITVGLAVGLVVSAPATGKAKFKQVSQRVLNHLSGAPVTRYYAAHPEQAPPQLQSTLRAVQRLAKPGYRSGPPS